MAENEDFWDDLLAHVRDRVLIPVAGPELTIVAAGDGTCLTLTELIAARIVQRYGLTVSSARMTMGEAAAAYVRERGREQTERLYRFVSDVIRDVQDQQCAPLRRLAEITDLSLFVSTTPDRLLAKAVNDVRFGGREEARELTFSPNQDTGKQAGNLLAPASADTTVVRLFGQAASTPQFALHDEDLLEWLHELLSDTGSLPEWIAYALKHQPLLFIGCDVPDWLGRFLLRLSSKSRISLESKQFFFVGTSTFIEPQLSSFFSTYGGPTRVQHLQMEPGEFVDELHRRWQGRLPAADRRIASEVAVSRPSSQSTIFLSYMHEDVECARKLAAHIRDEGGDVWFDERQIEPGDRWEEEILRAIRRPIQLFVAVISANTEREEEGYVFREWREAVERSFSIPRRKFIIPVVIDSPANDPSTYQQVPDEFHRYDFGYAPAGEPDATLRTMIVEAIKAMRRRGAA